MPQAWNLGLKDDRGNPLMLGDVGDGVRWDRPDKPWGVRAWLGNVWFALVVAWACWQWWIGSIRASPWELAIWGVPAASVAILLVLQWKFASPSLRRRVWAPRAWICAHGRCGGCGYGLREVEPCGDGCVPCPECGAAWNKERWTLVGRDPLENRRLMGMVGSYGAWTDVDDRGVPCDDARGWYPGWVESDRIDAAVRARVRGAVGRSSGVRWGFWMLGIAAVWIGAVCVLMVVRDPMPRDWWFDFGLLSIVTGLIAAVLGYVAFRTAGRAADRRAASLEAGRCVNCGGVLAGPAGFDGCTACGECGRAWRREAPAAS